MAGKSGKSKAPPGPLQRRKTAGDGPTLTGGIRGRPDPKRPPARPSQAQLARKAKAEELAASYCCVGNLAKCSAPCPCASGTNVVTIHSVEVVTVTADSAGLVNLFIFPCAKSSTLTPTVTAGALPNSSGMASGSDPADYANLSANAAWLTCTGVEVTVSYIGNNTTNTAGSVQVGYLTNPSDFGSAQVSTIYDEPSMGPSLPATLNESRSVIYRPPFESGGMGAWSIPASDTPANTGSRPAWPAVVLTGAGLTASAALYKVTIVRKFDCVPSGTSVIHDQGVSVPSDSGMADFWRNAWQSMSGLYDAAKPALKAATAAALPEIRRLALRHLPELGMLAI